jgi:hypothetical protein
VSFRLRVRAVPSRMRSPRRSKTIVFVMAPLARHRRCAVILHGAVDGILANDRYP